MSRLNHTVMFKLHEGVSEQDRATAVQRLTDLGREPGVLHWVIKESIDTRKGHIIIEHALFENQESFEAFRTSAAHVRVGDFMKTIADWWVGDYLQD